jgi:hypothetical protein
MTRPVLNQDFLDIIRAMNNAEAEYLVVGAHAMAIHGVPRATGDLDIWIRPSRANSESVLRALQEFGAPVSAHGVTAADLEQPDTVYQIGLPPRRIDLMTGISGVSFDEAWPAMVEVELEGRHRPPRADPQQTGFRSGKGPDRPRDPREKLVAPHRIAVNRTAPIRNYVGGGFIPPLNPMNSARGSRGTARNRHILGGDCHDRAV